MRLLPPGALSTLLPMLVVGGIGGLMSWQYHAGLSRERDLVTHTWEVIASAGELLAAVADAETGQRGYVITGDPAFLAPYEQALARLPAIDSRVRELVSDNSGQQALLGRLQDLIGQKFTEMSEGIARRRDLGFDAAGAFVAGSEGRAIMDEARSVASRIVHAEQELLTQRAVRVRARERWVVLVGLAAALLSIATRGLVNAWLQRRSSIRRRRKGAT